LAVVYFLGHRYGISSRIDTALIAWISVTTVLSFCWFCVSVSFGLEFLVRYSRNLSPYVW